ncbi:MAG: MgtC/SapB family protein [Bacillota bacterium]|nr:MgtC/SapB family protein [Bacillota bacterium]
MSFISWLSKSDLQFLLRIIVAGLCGFAIGYERKNRAKGAGIRTHFIVACSAALMMIVSKYGFTDMVGVGGIRNTGADPSRIASQIVSGVGFLGAGMIFIQKQTVTGLTTAAGIWATSGIGMAIGAGMYGIGISASVLIVIAQIFFHSNIRWLKVPKMKNLFIYEVDEEGFRDMALKMLKKKGISVTKVNAGRDASTGKKDYIFTLEVPAKIDEEYLISMFDKYSCKIREKE